MQINVGFTNVYRAGCIYRSDFNNGSTALTHFKKGHCHFQSLIFSLSIHLEGHNNSQKN